MKFIIILSLLFISCSKEPNPVVLDDVTKLRTILNNNPDIIFDVLKYNKRKYIETHYSLVEQLQTEDILKKEKDINEFYKIFYKNPLKYTVHESDIVEHPNGLDTIILYEDYSERFSKRSFLVIEEFLERKPHVRLVIRPYTKSKDIKDEIAIKYVVAISTIDKKKSLLFREALFEEQHLYFQNKLQFLHGMISHLKIDNLLFEKALNSEETKKIIYRNKLSFKSFGMDGTPSTLVNGVLVQGANPYTLYELIIRNSKKFRSRAIPKK